MKKKTMKELFIILLIFTVIIILLIINKRTVDLHPVWAGSIFAGPVKLRPRKVKTNFNNILKGEDNIIINPRNYWICYVAGGY